MADVVINIKSDISDIEKDVIKLSRELRDAKTAIKDLDKTTAEYAKQKKNIDSLSAALTKQKDALQDLKIEAKKTSTGFAEVKDKMGDLKDEAITLQGSGVERLNASFGLLTEGFLNADFDKVKTGLKGVGGAMGAIPIFLLIEGVKLLIDNFDIVIEFAKSFTDSAKEQKQALNELNQAYDDLSSNLDEIAFKQKELTRITDTANKIAIENAKQRGASAKEINELEIKGNADKLKILGKAEENYRKQKAFAESQYLKALKTEDEDAIKKAKENLDKATSDYKSSIDARKSAEDGFAIFIEEKQTEAFEKQKEAAKKAKENRDKLRHDTLKSFDDAISDQDIQNEKIIGGQNKQIEAQIAANAAYDEKVKANSIKSYEEQLAWKKYLDEKAAQEAKQLLDRKYQTEANYFAATTSLAETFFQLQIDSAEGNEERQNELRKKAFNVDKALKASQATIDGYKAVTSTLAQGGAFAVPLAISVGVLAFANVAKILATKFNAGGGSSGSASTPRLSTGGGNAQTPNQTQLPTNQPIQPTTQFDDQGNRINQPIVVKVSEINDVQRKVARVEEQATF